jgi:hypothetical protein
MSIKQRKDLRSIELFSFHIKDFTTRELIWAEILQSDFKYRGINCTIKDLGVDNTGGIILGKLPNHNVDKKIIFQDGKELNLEIKTIPEYLKSFFTFKVNSLKSCIEQNAKILVPRKNNFYLIGQKAIKYFLKNNVPKIYKNFSPNDFAVRINMNEIEYLIENKSIINKIWTLEAKKIIIEYSNILFAEKT